MRTLALFLALAFPAGLLAQEAAPPPPPAKPAAKDQVYKWVDKDGVVHYSSQPPTDNARPAKLPPLQTYKGGTNPNLSKFAKPAAGSAAASAPAAGGTSFIEVVTPSHDETFRGGERVVPVAVVVTPQLVEGQKLIYLLDGTPASAPTTDTSFALTGVERGSHTVSVALVDALGETVATSAGVSFHMKPPTADMGAPKKPAKPATPAKPKPKP